MAKVKITGHASGSGVLTITAPNTSTDRTVTLPDSTGTLLDTTSGLDATKLSGNLPAINGASLTNLPSKGKNLVINGAMQVAQRSTGTVAQANDSNEGYATLDRYSLEFGNSAGGTITTSQDTESPTGFGTSYKLNVTTADTSVDTNHIVFVRHSIEAQNMRQSGWDYTSSSSNITLSFWVKNSKTGIYCASVFLSDSGSRMYTTEYTVSQANTWEKKTITMPGDSNLVFNNDTGDGLAIYFMLANASGRQGVAGAWGTNRYGTSNQVNFLDSTSNVAYITGIQLEVGSVATDFEHRSYGEELALCQRYYFAYMGGGIGTGNIGMGYYTLHNYINGYGGMFPVTMRETPSFLITNGTSYWNIYRRDASDFGDTLSASGINTRGFSFVLSGNISGTQTDTGVVGLNNAAGKLHFSAEL